MDWHFLKTGEWYSVVCWVLIIFLAVAFIVWCLYYFLGKD